MRVEDIDGPRTVPASVAGNLDELRWLGFDWDEGPDIGGPYAPYRQSLRADTYLAALARLAAQGLLFDDWLSRKDLQDAASAPHDPPTTIYGPAERARSAALAAERRAAGRTPALRARVTEFGCGGPLRVHDRYLGEQQVDLANAVGDLVVRRADGLWAYHLAVVVDDAAMAISEVVRGADLWPVTPGQVALARALGLPVPRYAHVPLLNEHGGERMAKRRGSTTLAHLRAAGARAERVIGALAVTLGWLPTPAPLSLRDALLAFHEHGVGATNRRWGDDLEQWLRQP